MKLLPHYFKWIGLVLFFAGFIVSIYGSIGSEDFIKGAEWVSRESIENTAEPMLPEKMTHIADVTVLMSLLIYILAKNKKEDEFMQKLRNESAFFVMVLTIAILLIVYLFNSEFRANLADILELEMIAYLIVRALKRQFILGEYEEQTVLGNTME